jgi:hypothetical protein
LPMLFLGDCNFVVASCIESMLRSSTRDLVADGGCSIN